MEIATIPTKNNLPGEALSSGKPSTKKDTANKALAASVQRHKQRGIIALFGTLPQDADFDYKKGRK